MVGSMINFNITGVIVVVVGILSTKDDDCPVITVLNNPKIPISPLMVSTNFPLVKKDEK